MKSEKELSHIIKKMNIKNENEINSDKEFVHMLKMMVQSAEEGTSYDTSIADHNVLEQMDSLMGNYKDAFPIVKIHKLAEFILLKIEEGLSLKNTDEIMAAIDFIWEEKEKANIKFVDVSVIPEYTDFMDTIKHINEDISYEKYEKNTIALVKNTCQKLILSIQENETERIKKELSCLECLAFLFDAILNQKIRENNRKG